ncbi:MAG TPA: head GIN domain-containing protein [Acidobacteriota bacterium]|nr:head GIN domain-containing protein [Acidobacteriota bacterium]
MTGGSRVSCAAAALALIMLTSGPALGGWWPLGHRSERGSGRVVEEERRVDDFTRIKSSGSCDLLVTVGSGKKVTVAFDDNLIDYIITEVHGRTLEVYSEGSYSSHRGCLVEITVPILESVKVSGSGDVTIEHLEGGDFSYSVSGSGDLRAEGEVDEVEINVSGSGDVDARDLIAKVACVTIRGSGDVHVYAGESLDARVYGSGDIYYYGNPDPAHTKVYGSGDIRHKR